MMFKHTKSQQNENFTIRSTKTQHTAHFKQPRRRLPWEKMQWPNWPCYEIEGPACQKQLW